MSSFLQEAAESGALAPTGEDAPEEAAQDDFVPGGSPTFPFGPGAPRPGGEEGKERKKRAAESPPAQVPGHLLRKPDPESPGRQDRPHHRPRPGDLPYHPDPLPPPEEQPLPHR